MIFWMYRVDLEHILKMHRDTVFMTIVDPDMYREIVLLVVSSSVSVVSVPAAARASLCVLSVLVIQTQVSFPKFYLEIHCRKVSNGEASQLGTAGQLEGIQCVPGSLSWYESE